MSVDSVKIAAQVSASGSHRAGHGEIAGRHVQLCADLFRRCHSLSERTGIRVRLINSRSVYHAFGALLEKYKFL